MCVCRVRHLTANIFPLHFIIKNKYSFRWRGCPTSVAHMRGKTLSDYPTFPGKYRICHFVYMLFAGPKPLRSQHIVERTTFATLDSTCFGLWAIWNDERPGYVCTI